MSGSEGTSYYDNYDRSILCDIDQANKITNDTQVNQLTSPPLSLQSSPHIQVNNIHLLHTVHVRSPTHSQLTGTYA